MGLDDEREREKQKRVLLLLQSMLEQLEGE